MAQSVFGQSFGGGPTPAGGPAMGGGPTPASGLIDRRPKQIPQWGQAAPGSGAIGTPAGPPGPSAHANPGPSFQGGPSAAPPLGGSNQTPSPMPMSPPQPIGDTYSAGFGGAGQQVGTGQGGGPSYQGGPQSVFGAQPPNMGGPPDGKPHQGGWLGPPQPVLQPPPRRPQPTIQGQAFQGGPTRGY